MQGENDIMGKALIEMAGLVGNIDEVKSLISQGADVNYEQVIRQGNSWGPTTTPLCHAARWGRAQIAAILIENGANVNLREPVGLSALHYASIYNHVLTMQLLISKGALIEARTDEGRTPLHEAAAKGQKEATTILLDHHADINSMDFVGRSVLSLAVDGNHLILVEHLANRGVDLDVASNNSISVTVLHEAALLVAGGRPYGGAGKGQAGTA